MTNHASPVRTATTDDIPAVVNVHLDSFPGFFLSFLGPRFLGTFYRSLVKSEYGVLLVTVSDQQVSGFVGGCIDERAFFRQLREKYALAFARDSVYAVARRPRIVPRLARALRRPSEAGVSGIPATLLSIGVRTDIQSNGLGTQLEKGFQHEMQTLGVRRWTLTTDDTTANRAIQFYEGLGYVRIRDFTTPEGRAMVEYASDPARQAM